MNGADIQERRRTLSAQLAEMSVGEIKRMYNDLYFFPDGGMRRHDSDARAIQAP